MDFSNVIEDNRRALISDLLHRIEDKLRPFHESLSWFLAALFQKVLPDDWREQWHAFVAEQEAEGFTIAPSSVTEMQTWIEAWAKDCKLWPEKVLPVPQEKLEVRMPKLVREAVPRVGTSVRTPRNEYVEAFEKQLQFAEECFVELERILAQMGQRLDAATNRDVIEIDAEVEAVDELLWHFYNAREVALDIWLKGDLSDGMLSRVINESRIPPRLGLPSYADPTQLARSLAQAGTISERLHARLARMNRTVFAMKAVETAGEAASYLLLFHAAGTVIVKSTGKWAFAKGAANLGVAVGGGVVVDEVIDRGLRAAGASEDTIKGARLAAAIVSFILAKKRMKEGGMERHKTTQPNTTPKPAASGGGTGKQSAGVMKSKPRKLAIQKPRTPRTRSTDRVTRPGSVSGNPENRLVETGIPLKDGSGWQKRWTRMTLQEELQQSRAFSDRYNQLVDESHAIPDAERRLYIFERMRQFRTEYRRKFLEERSGRR